MALIKGPGWRAMLQEKTCDKEEGARTLWCSFSGFWRERRSFLGRGGRAEGGTGRDRCTGAGAGWLASGAGRPGRPHPETTCAGRKDENGSLRRRPGALGLPRNLASASSRTPRPSCPQHPAGHGSRLPAGTARLRPAIRPQRPWGAIGAARPEGALRTSARDSSTTPG